MSLNEAFDRRCRYCSKQITMRPTADGTWLAFEGNKRHFCQPWISAADVVPPKGALIDWLVPPDRAEDMLVELQKAFEERWVPKYGARCAKRMFMTHSVGSIIGFWINWMKKHLNVLKFFAS